MGEQDHRDGIGVPELPSNVLVGRDSVLSGRQMFRRFFSRRDPALTIGAHCHLEEPQFALGKDARVSLGDYVFAANLLLLAERELCIGNRVFFGFNVVLADTDYHPLDAATRVLDAIAISPLAMGTPRPLLAVEPVQIDDDVWIGPNATILKGVHIGAGAFIEPGSLVTRDIPARARVMGNPAQIIGEV